MAQDVNQSETDVAAQVRTALVARISRERFDLWLPPECKWEWDDGALSIAFPNDFRRQIAHRMIVADLRAVVSQILGSKASIRLEVSVTDLKTAVDTPMSTVATPASQGDVHDENLANALARPRVKVDNWSTFVIGTSNQLAWTSVNMVVNQPGQVTPMLLHGPCGVGKSHLASALAQRLRTQKRQRRVLHITSEQFTNDFTEAFRGTGMPVLRRKYRDLDTLILDDVQFLIGKKATISELRHTVDVLVKAERQVVITSDRSLNELEPLGADFVARLRGGLVCPLLPLDEDTRFKILKRDLGEHQIDLSEDIIVQIAARAIGDARLLKGIANRLMAKAYSSEYRLTWDDCWNSIIDLVQATQPIVRLSDIERVVCDVFHLDANMLQSDCKTRSVSQPRMLAMFLARKYTPAAYQEIGEYFGKRRHSTVISAEKTVESWLEEDAKLHVARGRLSAREALRHVESHLNVG